MSISAETPASNQTTRPASGQRIAHRICPLCEACCGLEIKLDRDAASGREHIVSIKGHAEDVFSHGYICPKAVALKDLHEDPDRLRTPLVKRNGEFVQASWDEAFAEIEQRLGAVQQRHGKGAVGITLGNPIVHKLGLGLAIPRLLRSLGTKQIFSASTLDQIPRQLVCGWMYGHWLSVPVPDIDHSDWLLVIGANPLASNGSMWTVPDFRGRAKAMQARGGRLIVIDPRRTETAAVADEHLAIRPGADAFVLAAMVRQLFVDGLVQIGAAAPHVALGAGGLDALCDALAPFTPEVAAARSGIAAADIVRLTRELAAAPSAVVYGRMGANTQSYGSLCAWLIDVLNILTGRLDVPGGLMFPQAAAFAANSQPGPGAREGKGRGIVTGRHSSRVSGLPEVLGEFPITCLPEEIDTAGEGSIRALVTIASNPVLSSPGSQRLDAALATLDVMVSVDIYVNETTRHADVILPGRSPLEDSHYDIAFTQLSTRNQARYSPPVLAADGGDDALPSEWMILQRLTSIVQSKPARNWAEVQAADDLLLEQEVGKLAAQIVQAQGAAASTSAQAVGATVLGALQGLKGPDRWLDLALRTGPYGDLFGMKPQGLSLAKLAATPAGIDLGALQPRLPGALRTPTGQVDLVPAPLLAELTRAAADLNAPAPDLVVIGRRDVRSNNSWMHNLPTLAKGPFRGALQLHPVDAARLGLVDGARARLARADAPDRHVNVEIAVDGGLLPGVCCLPHGWGHDLPGTKLGLAAERPGANLNAVLDENLRDPLSGNAVLSGVAVTLRPV
jgi:anaerobic selenocysteine-containing dehydrogenase